MQAQRLRVPAWARKESMQLSADEISASHSYARMKNSRWFGGFCISECYVENDQWQFNDLRPAIPDAQLTIPGVG